MSIKREVKRERKSTYKHLRKLRKARDMASEATKNKKLPYKLSTVVEWFSEDAKFSTTKGIALLIHKGMPRYALLSHARKPVRRKK